MDMSNGIKFFVSNALVFSHIHNLYYNINHEGLRSAQQNLLDIAMANSNFDFVFSRPFTDFVK